MNRLAAFVALCWLCAATLRCEAQGNLVPNHSFEDHDTCQQMLGFYTATEGPLGWFSAGGSPDYYQGCLPSGTANGVPQGYYTFQYPQDGDSHIGLVTYQSPAGVREHVMIELDTTLIPGQTYFVSLYANAAWNGIKPNPPQHYIASNKVGMKFSVNSSPWSVGDPWPLPMNYAHVFHPWIVDDTVGWTLVSGSFIADSAYRYLAIGNYFDNASTDTVSLGASIQLPKGYTLIDNVCVSTDPEVCPLALTMENVGVEAIVLFPNPARLTISLAQVPRGSRLTINDSLGRTIVRREQVHGTWVGDMAAYARGTYFLRLEYEEGTRTYKFTLIE